MMFIAFNLRAGPWGPRNAGNILSGWAGSYANPGRLSCPFGRFVLASGPQVRTALARRLFRLFPPPGRNLAVMAGVQHFRDRPPLEFLRLGVMRIFQEAGLETLFDVRSLRAHHPRQEPHAGVEQDQGRELATRQHIVTDRDFLERPPLDHPLVHPLEAAADEHEARRLREVANASLQERLAARREHNARARVVRRSRRIDRPRQHVGTHHHAGSAARRRIVDRAVLVGGEIADIDRLARPDFLTERLAGEARAKRARKQLGEYRQYGRAPHGQPLAFSSNNPCGGSATILPLAMSTAGTYRSMNGISTFSPCARLISRRSPAPKFRTPITSPSFSPSFVSTDSPTRSA